jgi:tRNA pseudouridine38-40 synthase
MRIFVKITYNGKNYSGWQKQPNTSATIQELVENALSKIFRTRIEIIGCGRTDAGVHAIGYIFHFDSSVQDAKQLDQLFYAFSCITPNDIVFENYRIVHADAHARFDAISRTYEYRLRLGKNPFDGDFTWHYLNKSKPNIEKLNEVAGKMLEMESFDPLCKAHTDVLTKKCTITESRWYIDSADENLLIYRITANRFLRGMIRLLVGMCLNYSNGKLCMDQIVDSFYHRTRLPLDWSVPPQGLILKEIKYPFINDLP